jgi:hypothetical protein
MDWLTFLLAIGLLIAIIAVSAMIARARYDKEEDQE